MNVLNFAMTAALALSASAAFAQDAMEKMPATVADIVMASDDHTTLEQAVIAADMGEALMGEGPFTVFAPTDAAFAALPEGALEKALMPENREMLVQILGCHVVEARALAADVAQMVKDDGGTHPVKTIGNCNLNLTLDGDMVKINDTVTVTAADLQAGNGVVHVVNGVLLPAM